MKSLFGLYCYARTLLSECETYLLQYRDNFVQAELTGARNDLVLFTSEYEVQSNMARYPNFDALWFNGFLACQEALDSFAALTSASDDDREAA